MTPAVWKFAPVHVDTDAIECTVEARNAYGTAVTNANPKLPT